MVATSDPDASTPPRRRRRRVVRVSEADQKRIEKGLPPTWLEPRGDSEESQFRDSNDARLLGDVPPHWGTKL